MKQYVFTILLTAAVTFVLSWAVWRLSLRYKLYPGIRERDVHKTPTPRLGGIAMFLGVLAAFAMSSAHPYFSIVWSNPQQMYALLGATALIVVVGVLDDLWDLDWMIKLGAQFLAAGVIAWFGQLQIYTLPLGGMTIFSSWASFTLTVFSIVVVMNAVNFVDGLDGLVAGVCLIANAVFFAYSYMVLRDFGSNTYFTLASLIAAVLIGACIGSSHSTGAPREAVHGGCRCPHARTAHGVLGHRDHRSARPRVVDPTTTFGRSQLLGAFIPILLPIVVVYLPLLDFGLAVIRRMRAGASRRSPPTASTCTTACWTWGTPTLRRRAGLLRVDGLVGLSSAAHVHRHDPRVAGGPASSAIALRAIGIAACLVVTFLPSRRRAARPPVVPAPPEPQPDPAPAQEDARYRQPRLQHADPADHPGVVGGAVTAVLAVVGAVIGFLVAGTTGLWSALAGVLDRRRLPRDHRSSILIANRWYGDDLYVPIFFGIVIGRMDPQVRRLHRVAASPPRVSPGSIPACSSSPLVVSVLASLAVDVVVLLRMRVPHVSDVDTAHRPEAGDRTDEASEAPESPAADSASLQSLVVSERAPAR